MFALTPFQQQPIFKTSKVSRIRIRIYHVNIAHAQSATDGGTDGQTDARAVDIINVGARSRSPQLACSAGARRPLAMAGLYFLWLVVAAMCSVSSAAGSGNMTIMCDGKHRSGRLINIHLPVKDRCRFIIILL